MTDQHPITVPPELRRIWAEQARRMYSHDPVAWIEHVANQAARWGADQELEACCEWLYEHGYACAHTFLPADRRPKPPSLQEQALAKLAAIKRLWKASGNEPSDLVRLALEQLND